MDRPFLTDLLVEWLPELELDGHALEGGGRGDAPLAPAQVLHLLRRRRDRRRLLDHEAGVERCPVIISYCDNHLIVILFCHILEVESIN